MEVVSDFMNINGGTPARETCLYQHRLNIIYDANETQVSVSIDNLPPGLEFKPDTMSIIGRMDSLNLWHPCKDYIHSSLANLPDDAIPYADCYETLENLVPMSVGFMKNLRTIHYSGRNYGMFGALAYVADGHQITQEIVINVTYEVTIGGSNGNSGGGSTGVGGSGNTTAPQKQIITEQVRKTMILHPARSPRQFVLDYGMSNELIGENNEPTTPGDFLDWLDRLGKFVHGAC